MHPRSRFALGAALSALSVLFVSACGGNDVTDTPPSSSSSPPPSSASTLASNSLQALVYGAPDTSVPAGTNIPVTMMGQMRALFDLIRKSPDFTQVVMDLGDGTPVHVLDTNTGDKFLPSKFALGLSYILIDMKSKNDPQYASYLATYQTITTAMMAQSGSNYTYANTSWGEYYYLVTLNNLKAHGMLNEVFSDTMLATLQRRLTFCDMFGPDASGKTDTCPATGTPIDIASLNTAQNYYAVSYGIAGLRQKLGWSSPSFASKTDPSFSDEASNTHTTYYDQARFDRYSTLLIGEVTERTFEMGNEANLTPELKGYLRKSVDLILPQLNANGQGFNYGRSIGPYGDSAFMEVLTAAANAGVLTDQEKQVAYRFIYQAAQRFDTYWYDPSLPTPSVNMWVKGRGTDAYRGKPRVMGENFSLLHQYLYVNAWWNKLGFGGKAPMADTDYNAWLDALPHYTLTWYNQPGDTAHPYSAALVTVRDGRRVINLNLSQAPDYNSYTPYYPVPFSDKLIYGTTDLGYALLVPQVSYNGKTYIPVTYYKNLNVQQSNGQVVVSFDTAKFRLASKNAAYTTDLDLQVHTVLTFAHGSVARSDTLSTGSLTGNLSVETDFTSFADFASTQANGDGVSVTYANSAATGYAASGFDTCVLSAFDTANGTTNPLSTTPIGQLHSNFACTTKPFALGAGATRTFGWTLKYADPA
jgi:hypothetical protein